MALQDLAERSVRILVSAVNVANTEISYLNTALHAQQEFARQLLADIWRRVIEANEMSIELANQELLIAQLREQVTTLKAGLASERLQGDIFREELESERLLHIQIQDVLLHRRQKDLDAFLPHLETVSPEVTSEMAEPPVAQPTQVTIPAALESVPMSREPAYRRHGERRAE